MTGGGSLEGITFTTCADAYAIGKALDTAATSTESYYVKGKITKIITDLSTIPGTYKNVNLTIADTTGTLDCYYTNNVDNAEFTSANQVPVVGAEIVVYGPMKNYLNKNTNKTYPEMVNGYIYNVISNEAATVSEDAITIADFIAKADVVNWYKLTGTITNLSNGTYKNATEYGNFDLQDATGTIQVYGLTATQVSKNDKSFSTLGLKDGDNITICGQYKNFNGTHEVAGPAYFISKN